MEKQVKARFTYLRISPLKLRRIANLVRGKSSSDMLAVLQAMTHKGARIVEKIIKSAVQNARTSHNISSEDFIVSKIYVDGAGMLKRFQPQSKGRAHPIKKRMSHLTVYVKPIE